jgi:ESCRT-II complex subunit VPS25
MRWRELILKYAKHRKQAIVNINDDTELFVNEKINRRLDKESREIIMNELCNTKNASIVGKNTGTYEIYWLTLEEWSNSIYSFAVNNGMTSSVLTFFELINEYKDEEFFQLHEQVLLKALKQLESKGKCEVMDIDGSFGVKFF